MRIVYFTGYWPPQRYANGILTAVNNLRPSLESLGHDVRIVSLNGDRSPADRNVVYVGETRKSSRLATLAFNRMPQRWRQYELLPRRAAQTLAAETADILEMEESHGWAHIIARRVRYPVVVRLHGPHFLVGAAARIGELSADDNERLRRERRLMAQAHFISAPSEYVLREVRQHLGLALPNAAVVPNAAPAIPEERFWRREGADADHVVFVGRFDRVKGADVALKAFAAAARTRPNLRLTFAGDSNGTLMHEGTHYEFTDFVAAALGPEMAARVSAVGRLTPESLLALRERAGVVVIASRTEMFPLVALEAAAIGAPIAACRVGGIPEMLTDGESALLAPCEDFEALGAAIGRIVDDQSFAAQLGAAARSKAKRDFAPSVIARATVAIYEQALEVAHFERGGMEQG